MNMDFDIPDISENVGKAAGGGKHRKPRRAGKIRLGDSLRSISREYTATRERMDEDKHIEFYSLSEGQEHFPFYGMEVSIIGVCIRNKKTAAIYMELPLDKREDLIKKTVCIGRRRRRITGYDHLLRYGDLHFRNQTGKGGKGGNHCPYGQ